MKNRNFIEGIKILTKYLDLDKYNLFAEHDQIYVNCDCGASEICSKDKSYLEELGWFIAKDDSWSAFV